MGLVIRANAHGLQVGYKSVFAHGSKKVEFLKFDELIEKVDNRDILGFHIELCVGFGAKFTSPTKFIEEIESMLLDYYTSIVQRLSNWEKPAPQLKI